MLERIAETSPLFKARTAGVFWVMTILTGTVALVALGKLGVTANLIAAVCYIAAMTLHELRSSRGDFAISRNAQFTDNPRVKRYCVILARTRLLEQGKVRGPLPSLNP